MKKLILTAIMFCMTASIYAEETRYYDRNGKFVGREIKGNYYDSFGRKTGQDIGGTFYNNRGQQSGSIKNGKSKSNAYRTTPINPGSKPTFSRSGRK